MGMLAGKNALITGCRRGIGRAAAEVFAREGANLWACARQADAAFEEDMAALAERYGVWVKPVCFDLADEDACKAGVRDILKEKLPVDVLVNNAGVTGRHMLMQMTPLSALRDVMQVNFIAPVLLTQAITRAMAREKRGAVINVISTAGLGPSAGYGAYGASKAALAQFTRTMAAELAQTGIRVNGVAPSAVQTDMFAGLNEDARQNTLQAVAAGRAAAPAEVAETIAFLASDKASYINGQIIRVDGGM